LHTAALPAGALSAANEHAVSSVRRVEREARIKTTATRVSVEDERRFLAAVRGALHAHGMADLRSTHDQLRAMQQDIETALASEVNEPISCSLRAMSDERLHRVLATAVTLSRRYQGELPRPGFFEYLMVARRYQMVVVMLLSAFGLSLVRSLREFALPMGVLLMSLGALNVLQTARRERMESEARELERARDVYRAESRRIVQEFERLWPAAVSQHLQEQTPELLGKIERALREQAARAAADASIFKQRLQRQLQGCDASERRLATTARARELAGASLAQLRGEIKQLLTTSLLAAR
jgi:hypothetical protein